MQKIFSLLMLLFVISWVHAGEMTVPVRLDSERIQTTTGPDGIILQYRHRDAYSLGQPGAPDIPALRLRVLLPAGARVTGVQVSRSGEVVIGHFALAPFQGYHIISRGKGAPVAPDPAIYTAAASYPRQPVVLQRQGTLRGYTICYLALYPFAYQPTSGRLTFFSQAELTIRYEPGRSVRAPANRDVNRMVADLVHNSRDMTAFYPDKQNPRLHKDDYDMLIITTDDLLSAATAYATFRQGHGISSVIKTISAINSEYSGTTTQLKVKSCILDYYSNSNITYVFFIGDGGTSSSYSVPDQNLYVYLDWAYESDNTIPGDVFFSSMDGQFDWNSDGDGQVGEMGQDSADITPDLAIGRLPVRTGTQVADYQAKMDAYIGAATDGDLVPDLLLSGVTLWESGDAESKSENMYTNYIQPYWPVHNKHEFYDTSSGVTVTIASLTDQIEDNHNFFHMATHGNVTIWGMESGSSFDSGDALALENTPGIVATIACISNAFDPEVSGASDPCLGEAFVRNPDGGSVLYVGCARYGIGYSGGTSAHGPSFQYDDRFFQHTLQSTYNHRTGLAFTQAKVELVGDANSDCSFRWVHFGLNHVGDPTLQAHTEITGAALNYDSHAIDDTGGNNNGIANPGETINLDVTLSNSGSASAENVTTTLATTSPYATVTQASSTYPDILGSHAEDNQTPFTLDIDAGTPGNTEIPLTLSWNATGYSGQVTFSVWVYDLPFTEDILVVSGDDDTDYSAAFVSSVQAAGYAPDTWIVSSVGNPSVNDLLPYKMVIWTTGNDWSNTMPTESEAALIGYLDAGGALYFSSQDYLYEAYGSTGTSTSPGDFAYDYLLTATFDHDENYTSVSGVTGDIIGDGLSLSLNTTFTNYADYVNPTAGGVVCLLTGSDNAAIRSPESKDFRVVFTGFAFELINSTTDQDLLMERIIDFCLPSACDPPTVTTNAATGISQTGASLNGTGNPQGCSGDAWFEYGLTTGYGITTPAQGIGSGSSDVAFQQAISGLSEDQTYHFRAVVETDGGTVYGSDMTFTTSGVQTLNAPVLQTPANGAVDQDTSLTLTWQDTNTSPQEDGYTVRFRASGGSYSYYAQGQNATSYGVLSLEYNTTYEWNARADGDGSTTGDSAWGNSGSDYTFTTRCAVPTVTTNAATGVSQTGATLNGTGNPQGCSGNAWFEYGLTTGYGITTPAQGIGSGSGDVPFSQAISGLTADTTYHFRAVVQTDGGTAYGDDQTFYTSGLEAPILTYPLENEGDLPTRITLQWRDLNSKTQESGYQLRYQLDGGEAQYIDLAADTTWYELSGLQASSTYHWAMRAMSSKAKSSDWSADYTFYTKAVDPADCTLAYVEESGSFRSNVGFSNLSATEEYVLATLYRADGTVDCTKVYTVPAYAYVPANRIVTDMGASVTSGSLTFAASEFVEIIGGPVDETSSDPSVIGVNRATGSTIYTPIVLKSGPWNTRIVLRNLADQPAACQLAFYDRRTASSTPSQTMDINIPAQGSWSADDIITVLGAGDGAYGLLRVAGDRTLSGYCHQYTDSHRGGIYPFYTREEESLQGYLALVSDTAEYRSNLGLVNLNNEPVTATVNFYYMHSLDASRTIELTPNLYEGIPDVIRWVRQETGTQYIDGFVTITADQPIFTIGGIVDNTSSDPGVIKALAGAYTHAYTPIVLKTDTWSTRIAVANVTPYGNTFTLRVYDPNTHAMLAQKTIVMSAYTLYKQEDIITNLGLPSGTYGRLEIISDAPVCGYALQLTNDNTSGVYPFRGKE